MRKRLIFFLICLTSLFLWLGLQSNRWDKACADFDAQIRSGDDAFDATVLQHRIFLENDSYYWLAFAREMISEGKWRIRETHADNLPEGRPVHWSQSVTWLLVAAGAIAKTFGVGDWNLAVEAGAVWINPFLHMLLIAGASTLAARFVGIIPALTMGTLLAVTPDVYWSFIALRPDHQTLHFICSFGSFLVLAFSGFGWISEKREKNKSEKWAWWISPVTPAKSTARWQFIVSGILAGTGFWIGATPQLAILIVIFVAVILAIGTGAWISTRKNKGANSQLTFEPRMWRLWGAAGAITSLLFYLLEYAPNHFGLRLEVNHPLYSVLIWALGEVLAGVTAFLALRQRPPLNNLLLFAIACLFLAGFLALFVLAPVSIYALKDPYMLRFHEVIGEFANFIVHSKGNITGKIFSSFGILPLLVIGTIFFALRSREDQATIVLAAFCSLGTLALALASAIQVRWMGIFEGLLALQAGVFLSILSIPSQKTIVLRNVVLSILAIQGFLFLQGRNTDVSGVENRSNLVNEVGQMAMFKRLSFQLKDDLKGQPARILCDPNLTPSLQYFGNIGGIVSFYWENGSGLHAATDAFADETPGGDVARKISQERGLTHLIITANMYLPRTFYYIKSGSDSLDESRKTLIGRLNTERKSPYDWILFTPEGSRRSFVYRSAVLKHEMKIYKLSPGS